MAQHDTYIDGRITRDNKEDKPGFLPNISISRRLLALENNESITAPENNPFKLPKATERQLVLGERNRELDKLEELKFKLFQKQAQGRDYIE